MSQSYELFCRVDTRDTDPQGLCRPSAVLGFLQEAATGAGAELGVAREDLMEQYDAFWMLARIWYRLDQPLYWGDTVRVHTWHRGGKGAAMYRDFDLYRDGVRVGEAVSTWVMADVNTHKLVRLGTIRQIALSDGGELCKDILLQKLVMPEEMTLAEERRLHYSECDINGHINNARYADFACDALEMERETDRYVSSLQVGYLAECLPGETLQLYTGVSGERSFVLGADREGKRRFTAAVTMGDL